MDDIQETREFKDMHKEGLSKESELDELAKHFGTDPLTTEVESNPKEKPSRDEMPPVVAEAKVVNKPKPEPVAEEKVSDSPIPIKGEPIRQTLPDGHTYTRIMPDVCSNCGLPKEHTTTHCFKRPLFPSTLRKFNEGKIDYRGEEWITLETT